MSWRKRVVLGLLVSIVVLSCTAIVGAPRVGAPRVEAAAATGGRGGLGAESGHEYRVIVNIPAFRLYLRRGDATIKEYPVAVGRAASPTRTGACVIASKLTNPTWYPPDGRPPVPPGPSNPLGSRWIGLSWPGYGIHGTNDPSSIGTAATLGCVRMHDRDVRELFDIVTVGTPVEVVYRTFEVLPAADPLDCSIIVHADVYGQGTNTPELAQSTIASNLAGRPLPDLDAPALQALLAAQTGMPEPVPWKVRVEVDGVPVEGVARVEARRVLVSVEALASAMGRAEGAEGSASTLGPAYVPLDTEALRALFDGTAMSWDPQRLCLTVSTAQAAPAAGAAAAEPATAGPGVSGSGTISGPE